jgi:diguanylate cyclase
LWRSTTSGRATRRWRTCASSPVDCLKIDRAFSAGVAEPGSDDHELVRTIVEFGRTRGMIFIAEGIEEAARHQELHRLGCELGQGFDFCRPMPVDALADALRGSAVIAA